MNPPPDAPLIGTLLHAVGAGCAALCYAPQRGVVGWKWQTYWIVQAAVCWLILPVVFAVATIPDLAVVLREAPSSAMWHSYLLGVLYGVGGIAFGAAIRYIGFSLTYAVAIGVSCVLGTLLPPLVEGTLGRFLALHGGGFVLGGVLLGATAMLVTGAVGLRKERELSGTTGASSFNARVGFPLVLLAGALSAVFSFSLAAGQPIADVAAAHGAGSYQGNVIYLFSHTGAFTTTLFYVSWLILRDRSWGELTSAGARAPLMRNYLLSALTGVLWYLQFFFYGLGHVRMGTFKFSSWAIHMIILILLSAAFGASIGEWRGTRRSTQGLLAFAVALLLVAVGAISYGNLLASAPSGH